MMVGYGRDTAVAFDIQGAIGFYSDDFKYENEKPFEFKIHLDQKREIILLSYNF